MKSNVTTRVRTFSIWIERRYGCLLGTFSPPNAIETHKNERKTIIVRIAAGIGMFTYDGAQHLTYVHN